MLGVPPAHTGLQAGIFNPESHPLDSLSPGAAQIADHIKEIEMRGRRAKIRWAGLDAHRLRPWKQATKCIFCGIDPARTPEGHLTQEHVYSRWIRRFVPRTMKTFKSLRATAYPDHIDFVLIARPGDVRDWQVLCVCSGCNNGWMSGQVVEGTSPSPETCSAALRGFPNRCYPFDLS
jgi:hypothetical protein